MAKIGITTDSAADLPNGMIESLGLHIIPIHIIVDGKDHLHGSEITDRDIIKFMREDRDIKTSPPLPSEFHDFYEDLESHYDRILSFHISSELSKSYLSSKSSGQILYENVAKKITFIDTRSVALGQGQIVKKASELIEKDLEDYNIIDQLGHYIKSSFLFFTVDDLHWLKRTGRTNAFSAFLGGLFDIQPIIGLKDGKLEPFGKKMGSASTLDRCIKLASEKSREYQEGHDIWIGHGDAPKKALHMRNELAKNLNRNPDGINIVEMGPSILAHTGPEALCLAMLDR